MNTYNSFTTLITLPSEIIVRLQHTLRVIFPQKFISFMLRIISWVVFFCCLKSPKKAPSFFMYFSSCGSCPGGFSLKIFLVIPCVRENVNNCWPLHTTYIVESVPDVVSIRQSPWELLLGLQVPSQQWKASFGHWLKWEGLDQHRHVSCRLLEWCVCTDWNENLAVKKDF